MGASERSDHAARPAGGEGAHVDARGARGVQAGTGNTQINYFYGRTVTDGVAPPPIADVHGVIDSPYRGLAKFEERDTAFFYGRHAATTELLERMSSRLSGPGLLVVSGVSGAGKSSLVRAGLLPRIRGEGLASAPEAASWPGVVVTPETAPLDELATRLAALLATDAATVRQSLAARPEDFAVIARQAALALPGPDAGGQLVGPAGAREGRLLVIVDQFEQLFKCAEEQQQAFVAALHAAATVPHGPARAPAALVVLVVRADFEARCADFPQLETAVKDRYLVTAMKPSELRLAITEPARQAGSRVDEDLVRTLLEDAGAARLPEPAGAAGGIRAGALPLLSHALDQAWRTKAGRHLTPADYARTGGIEQAVARSAQDAYETLSTAQQTAARLLFTRLTATSEDGTDTSRRAARAELLDSRSEAGPADVEAVLEVFAAQRLLTLAAGTVEISHEVLLTAWPLLRDTWLADTRADRIIRTRLTATAAEWDGHDRDNSYLYSGSLLESATRTAARIGADPDRHPPLSPPEQRFLQASQAAHRHRLTRRRRFTATLSALLVLAVGAATTTVVQNGQLTTRNRTVASQRDQADGIATADLAEALRVPDPETAKRLAIAAYRLAPDDVRTHSALASLYNQPEDFSYQIPGWLDYPGVMAKDGSAHVIARTSATKVRLVDVDTHRATLDLTVPGADLDYINGAALSGDDKYLSLHQSDGTVTIWDTGSGRPLPTRFHASGAYTGLDATGGLLVTEDSASYTLWATKSGRPVLVVPHAAPGVLALTDDDRYLIAAQGADLQLWDISKRQEVPHPNWQLGAGAIDDLAISDDSSTLAVRHGQTLNIVRFDGSGHPVTRKIAQPDPMGRMALSPDGKYIDFNGTVWTTDGDYSDPVFSYPAGCQGDTFGPDGSTLRCFTDSNEGSVLQLSLRTARNATILAGFPAATTLSRDGSTLAVQLGTIQIWDPVTGVMRGTLPVTPRDIAARLVLSDHGDLLAAPHPNGDIDIWDVGHARKLIKLAAHEDLSDEDKSPVAFSPDGGTLAVLTYEANGTSMLELWNTVTGVRRAVLAGARPDLEPGALDSARSPKILFSPDGSTLVSAVDQGIVDVPSGTRRVAPSSELRSAQAISRNGLIAAAGPVSNTVTLWDDRTLHQQNTIPADTALSGPTAFSPDGRLLASADGLGRIRLWDITSRQPFAIPFSSGDHPVDALAFSADGSTVLSVADARLVTYLIDPARITRALCAEVGPLPPTDWKTYLPDLPYRRTC